MDGVLGSADIGAEICGHPTRTTSDMNNSILAGPNSVGNWQEFYRQADLASNSGQQRISRAFINDYAMHWKSSPSAALMNELKSFAMLHQETLLLLSHLARRAEGVVLEFGPYLGGSTIAMAKAIAGSRDKLLITVEPGGEYLNHPDYPTDDILRDLKKNIERFRMTSVVNVIEGHSDRAEVVAKVEQLLGGQKVGLLFIDSDGKPGRDIGIYQKHLSDDCVIVLDDYLVTAADAADKEVGVRNWVSQAVESGAVRDLGVYPWGTWFGQRVAGKPLM